MSPTPILLAIAFFILLLGPSYGAPAAPRGAAEAGNETLVATIHFVDPVSGSLSLLTGRGYALRIVQVQLPASLEFKRMGAAVPFSELKPGRVVRVGLAPESVHGVRQAATLELQEAGP